jgi:hypothetical protein
MNALIINAIIVRFQVRLGFSLLDSFCAILFQYHLIVQFAGLHGAGNYSHQ